MEPNFVGCSMPKLSNDKAIDMGLCLEFIIEQLFSFENITREDFKYS